MRAIAWRVRHEAFAAAARGLRRAAIDGRAAAALEPLAAALAVHMAYEEAVVFPRYAEVAPADGPGALGVVLRDHTLIRAALVGGGGTGVEGQRNQPFPVD